MLINVPLSNKFEWYLKLITKFLKYYAKTQFQVLNLLGIKDDDCFIIPQAVGPLVCRAKEQETDLLLL